jgi:phage terminase large subunit
MVAAPNEGGGKSYLGCFWVLSQCLVYPGVKYLIGRKELINLRKTTLATFYKLVKEFDEKLIDVFKLNSMTNTIRFKNGSEIVLMDMAYKPSDPEYLRFGGLELTGAFVDESNECEEKALSILKTRIGRCKNKEIGIVPKLLETFNPSKNHVYFRYYKPFKDKNLAEHVEFIPALVTDNPYLDEVYISQLRKADKITRERLLNGNFEYDDDPSRLFEFDALNDLFTNKPFNVNNEQVKCFLTVDVARFGQDLTVLMLWKDFYVYKIHYFTKNNLKDLREYVEDLCIKEGIPRSHVVVDEDGVGGGLKDELVGCKGFVNNSRPIENKGEVVNFANLKTQCYYACADAVNARKVGVYSSFPEFARNRLIEDLEQVKRKNPDRDEKIRIVGKDEVKDVIGRSPDFGDAFSMRWFFELKPKFVVALA